MWSSWQDIEQAKIKERGYFGIYQIRMVSEDGNPISISRIQGIDEEGIIYIGRAKPSYTLAKRISEFQNVSRLGGASHHGGETYILLLTNWRYSGHHYIKHKLQYRVMRLYADRIEPELSEQESFKHKIDNEEVNALADYFNKYGELPPCNSSFPRKWNRFTDRLQELWVTSR